MADFNVTCNYEKDANFSSIKIGADAPVLEVELNEMQLIQQERLRKNTKALLNEGVKGLGTYEYTNNVLTITNELVMVNGEILEIPKASITVKEGQKVYVETWEEEINFLSDIKKHGYENSTEKVTNYLVDSRIGEETSRRLQVKYQLTLTPQNHRTYLEIGYVEHNEFILLANNLTAKPGNGIDFTVFSYFTLVSPLGKKFKLRATYEGELYTEPSTDAIIGLPLVVKDPKDIPWMITVDEQGRLSTVRVAKSPIQCHHYLQTPSPFAIIYKIEVTEQGELRLSSVCEVKIIDDEVTMLDKTWSSYKLNEHVKAQDKVVEDLAKEQTEFLKQVIAEKDKIINDLTQANNKLVTDLTNEKDKLVNDLTTEKDKIIADLRAENERLIEYTEAKINEMVSWYTVLNSPNGTLFEIKVDDEGVLETLEKEVKVHE